MKKWLTGLYTLLGLAALAALTVLLIALFGRAARPAQVGQSTSPIETPVETLTLTSIPSESEVVFQSPVETPTPLPTLTPWPTVTPSLTPTIPPVPTPLPAPVVTPIPTAVPPIIQPIPESIAQPYTILFRDGNAIRAVRSDGTGERVLINITDHVPLFLAGDSVGVDPREQGNVSPDGGQLALVLSDAESRESLPKGGEPQYSIYLLDLVSGDLRLLVQNGVEPVWSPDSSQIAYRDTLTLGLWIAQISTGQTREIYAVEQKGRHHVTEMGWSPDGKRLVFIDSVFRQSRTMMTIDAQGVEPAVVLVPSTIYWPSSPKWSPNGDAILYISNEGKSSGSTHFWNLWLINSDGTNPMQLTQDILVSSAQWSPDGQWIAFDGSIAYEEPEPLYELWLIDKSGQVLKRLTSNTTLKVNETSPTWSHDGTHLLFVRESEVWMLSLIDGSQTKLPVIPGFVAFAQSAKE